MQQNPSKSLWSPASIMIPILLFWGEPWTWAAHHFVSERAFQGVWLLAQQTCALRHSSPSLCRLCSFLPLTLDECQHHHTGMGVSRYGCIIVWVYGGTGIGLWVHDSMTVLVRRYQSIDVRMWVLDYRCMTVWHWAQQDCMVSLSGKWVAKYVIVIPVRVQYFPSPRHSRGFRNNHNGI